MTYEFKSFSVLSPSSQEPTDELILLFGSSKYEFTSSELLMKRLQQNALLTVRPILNNMEILKLISKLLNEILSDN